MTEWKNDRQRWADVVRAMIFNVMRENSHRSEKKETTDTDEMTGSDNGTAFFLGNLVTCSNEPTQQGALPLRNERRGTLTARP